MGQVHKIVVDIAPGEILYMPAGWFHHVENADPTIMVNFWTRGGPAILRYLSGELSGGQMAAGETS